MLSDHMAAGALELEQENKWLPSKQYQKISSINVSLVRQSEKVCPLSLSFREKVIMTKDRGSEDW